MMFGERVTANSLLMFIRKQVTKGAEGVQAANNIDDQQYARTPDVDPSKLDPRVLVTQVQAAQAQLAVMEAELETLRMKKAPTEIEQQLQEQLDLQ